jgi:DNA-binding MarR family transcriptional regulator
MNDQTKIGKNISILNRLAMRFYDRQLSRYGIGCGQQFFLYEIARAPGVTLQALAQKGHYDNGSATRATQKLEAEGLLRIEADASDKRIRRYYLTEKAAAALEATRDAKRAWRRILCEGFSPDETARAEALLARMADNACRYADQIEAEAREN